MTTADLFRRIAARLDEAGIPYMLTGSFAAAYHGRPRATQDVDIVIAASASQVTRLLRTFPPDEYYADESAAVEALRAETQFNVIDLATGWKVDFIVRKSRPFSRTEFERRIAAEIDGLRLYVASVEDVIIAKLEWSSLGGSQRQLEDVAGLIEVTGGALDNAYVERWVTALGIEAQWAAARHLGRGLDDSSDAGS